MTDSKIKDVQLKILEIMKYIDALCRNNGIVYYIMGGTALGAVRHKGFIPWDDDLDIFMTPDQYNNFKEAFYSDKSSDFVLQEWSTVEGYLEYAKVRMNNTTFIEKQFLNDKELHQGIYVDIMVLHKVPENRFIQKIVYFDSKFVTLYGLSKRGWKPKTKLQSIIFNSLKFLPCRFIAGNCYKRIYKYDNLKNKFKFCYWITPAKFYQGLFEEKFFSKPVDIPFEDTYLLGSEYIKDYLSYRYGDYMKLPPEKDREAAVHAYIYDTKKNYTEYLK